MIFGFIRHWFYRSVVVWCFVGGDGLKCMEFVQLRNPTFLVSPEQIAIMPKALAGSCVYSMHCILVVVTTTIWHTHFGAFVSFVFYLLYSYGSYPSKR